MVTDVGLDRGRHQVADRSAFADKLPYGGRRVAELRSVEDADAILLTRKVLGHPGAGRDAAALSRRGRDADMSRSRLGSRQVGNP